MVIVLAVIELQDGQREAFLREFLQVVPLVRAEAGCIEYGPAVDIETSIPAQPEPRANGVTVVEKWESLEALEQHLIAPHMLSYRKRVKDLVKNSTIHVLEPVEAV